MENYFAKVKDYLIELDQNIVSENEEDGVFVIDNEEMGITNMFVVVADPLVIVEDYLFDLKKESLEVYRELLKKNRDIVHGAFCLDESGTKVIFRDTLQVENLDLNELEATLNSLAVLLSEYSNEIIKFSK